MQDHSADVQTYVDSVKSGEMPTSKITLSTVDRYLSDLKNAGGRGFVLDKDKANKVINFIELLKHTKGQMAGKPLLLSDWQKFILWNAFGWVHKDTGKRRFTTVYCEVARKNAKSQLCSGIALYMTALDREGGAECYTVATKYDQAKIVWSGAVDILNCTDNCGGLFKSNMKKILQKETASFYEPLGRDSKTLDGLNPHCVIVDEFHAHPSRELLDVMESGMGARQQPMMFIITTAGFNTHSACYQERDYAINVANGTVADDTYFPIIYTLDEGDRWNDEKTWIKANPNLGKSVSIPDMRKMCAKAENSPMTLNNFLCKKLNIWTTSATTFFNMVKWEDNRTEFNINMLKGKKCWIGVDLASKTDLASLVAIFPIEDGQFVVVPRFYCPRDGAEVRSKTDKVPYLHWAEEGYLTLTDGARTDFSFIRKDIEDMFKEYDVQGMAFDKWNFEALYQDLVYSSAIPHNKVIEFGQTLANMSAPMKELEAMILDGKIIHNSHPILSWNAQNTVAYIDANENIRPDKKKSTEKIDGIVALIMAIGLWQKTQTGQSCDANKAVLVGF